MFIQLFKIGTSKDVQPKISLLKKADILINLEALLKIMNNLEESIETATEEIDDMSDHILLKLLNKNTSLVIMNGYYIY